MGALKFKLNGSIIEIDAGLAVVDLLYERSGITPVDKCLYLDKDKDIDIPLLPGDRIIICGREKIFVDDVNSDIGENPNVRIPARPQFNGSKLNLGASKAKVTGKELRECDAELSASQLFADLSGQVDVLIHDEWVLVLQDSDCYFTIPTGDDESVIDIEQCAQSDRQPPKGQGKYKIKIDNKDIVVEREKLIGEEILALARKNYKEWTLNQKLHGGRRKSIEAEQEVDLTRSGVERFETVKKQAQQGSSS